MHPSFNRNHRSRRQFSISPMVMFAVAAQGFRSGFTTPSPSSHLELLRLGVIHQEPRADMFTGIHAKERASECLEANYKQRRKFMQQSAASIASLFLPLQPQQLAALAINDLAEEVAQHQSPSEPYTRTPVSSTDKFQFSYTVTPPPSFVASNKPLKTHLDEINFAPPDLRGYTLGITVDPVRISSIQQFGSPEEVAARVVTAEVNRDGVFEVTLAKDPKEDATSGGGGGGYDIEYISDGKRGKKRFVTRIYVRDGFLYVLTVQSKESEYDRMREAEVMECVNSFKPL